LTFEVCATVAVAAFWIVLLLAAKRGVQWVRADLAFCVFGMSLLTGIVGGFFWLGDAFVTWANAQHPPAARDPQAARPSLAVFGAALTLVLFALKDVELIRRRDPPLKIALPEIFARWLPGLIAIAVGGLIGTTIFR
jgi:hypothetical protein